MAAAAASASSASSEWPASRLSCRRRETAFGRRWGWTMGEKAVAPEICAPGAVRSVVPRAPPFGCHCAAMTFCVLVRAMARTLNAPRSPGVVHADNPSERLPVQTAHRRTTGRTRRAEVPTHVQRPRVPAVRGFRAMRKRALPLALLALLALPAVANATPQPQPLTNSAAIDTTWVVLAALLVFFMQAGFAFLEIGFSRAKNAGTVVAKILTNLSIASIAYWACGFAFAFGTGKLIGHQGFFLSNYGDPNKTFGAMGFSDVTPEAKFFFQFVFAAVSLAIVWGTTLERIKFGVYIMFGLVFSAIIYPIG